MSLEPASLCVTLEAAVRSSGMGVWAIHGPRGPVTLNERSCVIHGLAPTGSVELTFAEYLALVHIDDRWKLRDVLGSATPGDFRNLEFRINGGAGTRWVCLSGDVAENSDANRSAVVGSCFDISERILVRQQLLQAQKMEAVGHLSAGIAHNFNNILNVILPSLHLLAPHVKQDGTKLVRNAQLAAEQASDLVSELMLVAGQKTSLARKALNLAKIVERVVRICRTTFGRWVQLTFDCEYEMPACLANSSQMEQVLLNLLLNARDAFERGSTSCPRIDLELDVEDNYLVLQVMDNGPGMDAATLQRVFEPFFTTKDAGTGLGLATAYAIIDGHGGTIECISKPCRGAEFVLRLPVYASELESVSEDTASACQYSE